MLKKIGTLGLFFLFIFTVSAQDMPKVAVLDATLGEGVDQNASAIVADTINEQFVKSPQYRVTDRAYISSIQEEKKFQLSGDVSEDDIKALGETFGADFICAPHVSVLGTTYTISARLISVETAEVFSQESRRMKGDMDVLFLLAEFVGAGLVGTDPVSHEMEPEQVAEDREPVEEEKVVQETVKPAPTYTPPVRNSWTPDEAASHFVFSWVFPAYTTDIENADSVSIIELDQAYGYDVEDYGFDMHYLETFMKYGYISLGLTMTMQSLYDTSSEYGNFLNVEPYIGLGGIVAPVSFLDIYGGLTLGYMGFVLGEYWDESGEFVLGEYWNESGEFASGLTFGLEIGSDINLGGLGLSLRYRYSYASELTGDVILTDGSGDMGHGGFMVGAGFYF